MGNWKRVVLCAFVLTMLSMMFMAGTAYTATPKDTLIVASSDSPQNLDVNKSVHFASQEVVVGSLYEPLWEYSTVDAKGTGLREPDFSRPMEPRLAESWEVSGDGMTWTVRLRKGVRSAAGNELTAEDVKWTWDRIWNTKGLGMFY